MENTVIEKKPSVKLIRYKDLDALRGIAALMVVFYHFTFLREPSITAFFWGRFGVDIFFIISGFVIFMSINKVSNVSEFAINRFSRLFPTYWFCVTLTALIQFLVLILNFVHRNANPITISKYFANLTMFQKYLGFADVDGPYWTLSVELLFYIGIALLLKFNKIKNIFNIGCLMVFIGFINDYLGAKVPAWPYKQILFYFPLIGYISLFFAGIIFYKIVNSNESKLKLYATLLFCYLVRIKIYDIILATTSGINFIEPIIFIIIFGVFILFVNQKLSFITNEITLFFGKISYSLYLIHQYIGINVIMPGLERILHLPLLLCVLIALVCVITIAYLIYRFIEVPGGKYLKATFQKQYIKVLANN